MPEEQYTTLRRARWQTYAIAFVITAAIFGTILYANNYFNDRRIAEIRATQDNISIDILSLETQFDLLAENSCATIAENSVLSRELRPLAARLSYIESQAVFDTEELVRLKRYYSLLQIKDLILLERVAGKCNIEPVSILYFYSNEGDCPECEQQGYALTALSKEYPQLRIYSFDYNLDLSALQTLISINDVQPELPAIVIDGTVYSGYQDVEALEAALSQITDLETLRVAADSAEVATSTTQD